MRRIALTGWDIFSKLDAVNDSESGGRHFIACFSAPEGSLNPRIKPARKKDKNHMNPLIQLKKATPLFVIMLVLACFALSPQAFAAATPTFTPNQGCACQRYKNVTISSGTSGGGIFVKINGNAGGWISNPGIWPVGDLKTGPKTLQAAHTSNPPANNETPTIDSGWKQSGTYKWCWYCPKVVITVLVILGIAALIWLFRKRSSASR